MLMLLLMAMMGSPILANDGSSMTVNLKGVNQTTHEVSGIVTDEKGEPLIGVTVGEAGTQNGVGTDIEGKYSLKVSNPNAILKFSYVGYNSIEERINGRTSINVVLVESVNVLGEVVVVAYGTQRKNTVSGSLSTVKADKIVSTASTVSAMLQGQVAGMNVAQSSGKPGTGGNIVIRGRGSVSLGVEPLWVVDGIVGGTTSSLNPNDIESVTVLKDGSATALYGSRGANGVIIVTTKSAKLGDNKIDIGIKVGVSDLTTGKFSMMNSKELYEYTDIMFNNNPDARNNYKWFNPSLMENDTDWWNIATQTSLTTNYNVTYRTGTEKIRSYLAGDYYKEEGTIKGYGYERFTLRNNMVYKFNEKLNINASIAGNYSNTSDRSRSLYSSFSYLPWDTPYNSLGELKKGNEGNDIGTGKPMSDYWFGRDKSNYLYDNSMNWSTSKGLGVDLSIGFDYTIIDGLVFESKNNFGFYSSSSKSYDDPKSLGAISDNGRIGIGEEHTRARYTNQLLRYNNTFNSLHEISAFLGHEYRDYWTRSSGLTGKGIPQGRPVPDVAAEPKSIKGNEQFSMKTEGYYFNGNYTYDNRYFGQFSFRRDGDSSFGSDKRYGNFWTVGGGWNLHGEKFMNNDVVDMLRIRASYGITGNAPGGYQSRDLYSLNREYDSKPGAFPSQKGNPTITWETTKSTNIGTDIRLFNRLGITADFYIKNVSGLLYRKPLSTLSGFDGQYVNSGRLQNTGIEITVSPEIIKTQDWNWTLDFNIAYNKNQMKELADGKEYEISGNEIRMVGDPLGTYYLREWGGVDIMTGAPTWIKKDKDGNRSYVLKDSETESYNIGKTRYPNLQGGIQTRLSYKDITLSATFAYATGFYINHRGREIYDNDGAEIQYNSMKLKDGWSRWEKPGDHATHPKPMIGGNQAAHRDGSTRLLERGDFFKMKTLAVTYNVPQKTLRNLGVKSAQLGFSADNIFTITEFSGIDPEVAVNGAAYDASQYPIPRKYMFTLSLGL